MISHIHSHFDTAFLLVTAIIVCLSVCIIPLFDLLSWSFSQLQEFGLLLDNSTDLDQLLLWAKKTIRRTVTKVP